MINLADPIERQKLQFQIKSDVETSCQKHFADGPRKHLGASIIGHECSAYLWNTFRWLKQEAFSGQMLRLFNRGHTEEARFVKWLELAGFKVWEHDPETGKQFKIAGANGHFGGSLDGIVLYIIYNIYLLAEFKTHGEKSFVKLKADGVRKAKPQHFRQMCSYGKVYNFQYGLYVAVNKNTDELYFEIVELDFKLAEDLFRKAEGIIYSQAQSSKIAQSETYTECKWCNFKGICHRGEEPEKNCRSCFNCVPTEAGSWTCSLSNEKLADEVIAVGCDSWRRIV